MLSPILSFHAVPLLPLDGPAPLRLWLAVIISISIFYEVFKLSLIRDKKAATFSSVCRSSSGSCPSADLLLPLAEAKVPGYKHLQKTIDLALKLGEVSMELEETKVGHEIKRVHGRMCRPSPSHPTDLSSSPHVSPLMIAFNILAFGLKRLSSGGSLQFPFPLCPLPPFCLFFAPLYRLCFRCLYQGKLKQSTQKAQELRMLLQAERNCQGLNMRPFSALRDRLLQAEVLRLQAVESLKGERQKVEVLTKQKQMLADDLRRCLHARKAVEDCLRRAAATHAMYTTTQQQQQLLHQHQQHQLHQHQQHQLHQHQQQQLHEQELHQEHQHQQHQLHQHQQHQLHQHQQYQLHQQELQQEQRQHQKAKTQHPPNQQQEEAQVQKADVAGTPPQPPHPHQDVQRSNKDHPQQQHRGRGMQQQMQRRTRPTAEGFSHEQTKASKATPATETGQSSSIPAASCCFAANAPSCCSSCCNVSTAASNDHTTTVSLPPQLQHRSCRYAINPPARVDGNYNSPQYQDAPPTHKHSIPKCTDTPMRPCQQRGVDPPCCSCCCLSAAVNSNNSCPPKPNAPPSGGSFCRSVSVPATSQ